MTVLTTDIVPLGAVAPGAFAQNTAFFATALTPKMAIAGHASKIILTMAFATTAPIIQISRNNGVTYESLNSANTIPIGQEFNITIMAHAGDVINFQASNTGGTTVTYFYVDEST